MPFMAPVLQAQNDSTLILSPDILQEKDIRVRNNDLAPSLFYSATRSEEQSDNLPFSTWSISAEEILRNGFVTLGDVLKAAPGIRVSQPGNAQEGEMFLIRGMSGNQYVKILINDVPVKPSVMGGTPIGAQFPVRQAQRIEVLYGPATALYGHEACAGVVNIILKESDRPLFTQADLSFGNNGFNSLDLMFGGKLGRNKKAFRFSLYGSSTVRNWYSSDQTSDTIALFSMNTYTPSVWATPYYKSSFNYRPRDQGEGFTLRSAMPHESRMLGLDLRWRGFQFTYHRLVRSDQSALGLNPLSLSAENPADYVRERTDIFALQRRYANQRRESYHALSFTRYNMDRYSSASYILDRVMKASFRFRQDSLPTQDLFTTFKEVELEYGFFAGYHAAACLDVRVESKTTFRLGKYWQWTGGMISQFSRGMPFTSYMREPANIRLFNPPLFPFRTALDLVYVTGLEGDIYTQLAYKRRRFSASFSGMIASGSGDVTSGVWTALNPRVALLWKADSSFSVWANYGTGMRYGTAFYLRNTYLVGEGGYLRRGEPVPFGASSEKTQSTEIGMRYTSKSLLADINFFTQKGRDLILNNMLFENDYFGKGNFYFGYQNALDQTLYGLQGHLKGLNVVDLDIVNKRNSRLRGYMEYFLQYAWGHSVVVPDNIRINEVYNQPRWQRQFRVFFTLGKAEVIISTNTQSSTLSKSTLYGAKESLIYLPVRHPKFRTNDLSLRWYFSKYFLGYFHLQNMWNRQYAGLDATGTSDDLMYNLQQGRIFRFGVSYSVN